MDAGVCLTGTDIISSTTETIDDTDNYLVGQQRDTRTRHSVVVIDFDYSEVKLNTCQKNNRNYNYVVVLTTPESGLQKHER
jgi:hypothetical protein